MPRGQNTIEIVTPTAGARFDLPVHKLAPEMLAAGSFNVECSPTSILQARTGFTPIPGNAAPQRPITGGVSWIGTQNTLYMIVADDTRWWQYFPGSPTPWQSLSGKAPVGADDFTVFAAFQVSGVDNLFGVNNNTSGGSVLPGRSFTDGVENGTVTLTSATANFVPSDIQRAIVGANIPAGTIVAQVVNSTTIIMSNPATASATGVTILLAAVDVNTEGGLLQWTAGTTTVVSVVGLPFQSALGCFVLANRLVVFGTVEQGTFYPHRVRWSQFNNPTVFPIQDVADIADPGGNITAGLRMGNLQAFLYLGGTEGTGALVSMIAQAGDDANAFAFQEFAVGEGVVPPASVAAIMAVNGYHYYIGSDAHIWVFDGILPRNFGIAVQSDIQANANFPELLHSFAVYSPTTRQGRFYFPTVGFPYPNRCVYYSFDFNRWEAPAAYQQRFRSGFTGPFRQGTKPVAFAGGVDGEVYQLDFGITDNGTPIAFNATWGVRNTNPLEAMQVQFAEAFIQQAVGDNDYVALVVSGLRTPLDTSTTGAVYLMELSQANNFQQLTAPGIGGPATSYYNWLQVSLQGTVSQSFMCLGAYIQVDPRAKGVYNLIGNGPQ